MESCLSCCLGGPPWLADPPLAGYPPPCDRWLGHSAFTLTKHTCFGKKQASVNMIKGSAGCLVPSRKGWLSVVTVNKVAWRVQRMFEKISAQSRTKMYIQQTKSTKSGSWFCSFCQNKVQSAKKVLALVLFLAKTTKTSFLRQNKEIKFRHLKSFCLFLAALSHWCCESLLFSWLWQVHSSHCFYLVFKIFKTKIHKPTDSGVHKLTDSAVQTFPNVVESLCRSTLPPLRKALQGKRKPVSSLKKFWSGRDTEVWLWSFGAWTLTFRFLGFFCVNAHGRRPNTQKRSYDHSVIKKKIRTFLPLLKLDKQETVMYVTFRNTEYCTRLCAVWFRRMHIDADPRFCLCRVLELDSSTPQVESRLCSVLSGEHSLRQFRSHLSGQAK